MNREAAVVTVPMSNGAPPLRWLGARIHGSRLVRPQLLQAVPGLAALVFWPGAWLSPGQVAVVMSCLLPWGLTTLMRLEQDLHVARATQPRSGEPHLSRSDGVEPAAVSQANPINGDN